MSGPECQLTVVVAFYNMRREAARTLYTLSAVYQQRITAEQYRVIALDNGSSEPLDPAMVRSHGKNFEYIFIETRSMSPAAALNQGIAEARTPYVMLMIDGARMASPSLLATTLEAFSAFPNPLVYTLGLHLGAKSQNVASQEGYDRTAEDVLLGTVDWKTNGYELFQISNVDNNLFHFLGRMPESNCFALRSDALAKHGGFDVRFASSGGGLVNLEIFERFLRQPDIVPVALVGEATFHQFHGGVSTNVSRETHPLPKYLAEYEQLFGRRYAPPEYYPSYWGRFNATTKHLMPAPPFRQQLRFITLLIEAGRLAEARQLLNLMRPIDPDAVELNHLTGLVHMKEQNYTAAEQHFRQAIRHDHFGGARRFYALGNALRMQGRQDEAAEAFAVAVNSGDAGGLGFVAWAQLEEQRGNFPKAASLLERALKGDSRQKSLVIAFLGNLYLRMGRTTDAEKLFDRTLELNPHDLRVLCAKAAHGLSRSSKEHSLRDHLRAADLFITSPPQRHSTLCAALAHGLHALGEFRRAHEIASLGLEADPDNHTLLFSLGNACRRLGRDDEAILNLKKAVRRGYPGATPYLLMADIERRRDTNLTRLLLLRAKLADPNNAKVKAEQEQIRVPKPVFSATDPDSFIFTHVPKCAGTTLRRLLSEAGYYSGLDLDQIHVPGQLGRSPRENLVQLTDESLASLRRRDIRLLADHSSHGMERTLNISSLRRPFRFTMLREPLARFLSYYYFFFYNPRVNEDGLKGIDFHALDREKAMQLIKEYANAQTGFLSGSTAERGGQRPVEADLKTALENLEHSYTCFGIFEDFETSMRVMKRLAPNWLKFVNDDYVPEANRNDPSYKSKTSAIHPQVLACFRDHNKLDYALHLFATSLFHQRYLSLV